ncbi:hypothetical protein NX059_009820 [Plenodomus lindquistii]|nr:hypothetical protein NX059_009820 [Plenodomus lindquistii]
MAPGTKRKRNSIRSKTQKRTKYAESGDHETQTQTQSTEEGDLWLVEAILDEKIEKGRTLYKLQWKGLDPATGTPWEPTWEPRANCTGVLLASWEIAKTTKGRGERATREKATKGQGKRAPREGSRGRGALRKGEPAQRTLQFGRRSRGLESSPSASTTRSATFDSAPSTPTANSATRNALASSAATTPTGAGAGALGPPRQSPRIPIPRRGSSFDAEEYERYSQLAASQSQSQFSIQSQSPATDLDSSQLFAATRVQSHQYSSGIVPDSQDSAGEATFLPPTQRTEGSQQQSTASTDASLEAEQEEEDSGLLEIVQQGASREVSPARSIAETIPDTNTAIESQSQIVPTNTQGPIEIQESTTQTHDVIEISDTAETSDESQDQETQDESQDGNAQVTRQALSQQKNQIEVVKEIGDAQIQQVVCPEDEVPLLLEDASEEAETSRVQSQDQDQHKLQHEKEVTIEGRSRSVFVNIDDRLLDEPENDLPTEDDTSTRQSFVQVPHTQSQHESPRPSEEEVDGETERLSENSIRREATVPQSSVGLHKHPSSEEHTQTPFQSPPLHQSQSPRQVRALDPAHTSRRRSGPSAPPRQVGDPGTATGDTSTTPTFIHVQPPQPDQTPFNSASNIQERQRSLPAEPTAHISAHSPSQGVTWAQSLDGELNNTSWMLTQPSQSIPDTVRRRDFACDSQPPIYTGQSTESRQQQAQVVPLDLDISFQEHLPESIRTTIEHDPAKERESSESRHDSSQESPERPGSPVYSSSPIRDPPSFSLATVASKLPSRPTTPLRTSSWSMMSGESTGDQVRRALEEAFAKKLAENPFVPTRRRGRRSEVNATPTSAEPSVASVSARRLLGPTASQVDNDGTRSPSTVPDHAPAPPGLTSLSAVVLAPSNDNPAEDPKDTEMDVIAEPMPEVAQVAPEPELPLGDFVDAELDDDDNEQMSDADDEDSGSLLHDDLQLEPEEYIVPLFIEGRQLDMYTAHIQQHKDVLQEFLKDPRGFTPLSRVEEILGYLRAIETHVDLVFAEAEQCSAGETATQVEFAAQFGMENSAKLRFLHSFFHQYRTHEKHVVLVVEDDNDTLFRFLETFCKAKYVHFNMPTKGRTADARLTDGLLSVTIIPSTASSIIRAPDLIICLDGVQEAAKLRQKNWARSPVRRNVPVLHLVVPRTVGHIERYLSQSLSHLDKLHTTVAGLAQISVSADIGKPVDESTPRAPAIAKLVVDWLVDGSDEDAWPLPSIGSIKDVIEYQTQLSSSQASTTPPAPERNKRPLDDEDFDTAKRMRYTPQPQNSSSAHHDQETTHISDSMPGTAGNLSGGAVETSLRRQLARTEKALHDERTAREADQEKLRMWERQLGEHEDLRSEHRAIIAKTKAMEAKLETTTKSLEVTRERLQTRTAELNEKTRQLEEQRATDALSSDEKTVEITKLRQELAKAQLERASAVNESHSDKSLLEYTKEARSAAENSLSAAQATIQELTTANQKLTHQASGEPAKLKALHLDRQTATLTKQIQALRMELVALKKAFTLKDEEVTRLKNGRPGVGTRGQSLTPQPKTRSRAASPMGGRVSNLRKE